MSSNIPKKGILAALWLPTDAEGNLLKRELAANIAWLKARGVYGILALGSTGEFPHMTVAQRQDALATVAELAAPLPVLANISDIRPRVVAELGRTARQLGLPAVTIMTPGFYPNTQDDVLEHFLHAADSSQLPVFLYNFPSLTGTRINIGTVAAFADRADMAGIKQSGGEFEYHKELIALGREKNFVVFSGADTRLPEVFGLGAVGCIGGLANIAPELMLHLYKVCREGAPGDIHPAFERLKQVGDTVDRLTFPLNVAAGMAARGVPVGEPKARVSPSSQKIYDGIVRDLGAAFEQWGLPRFDAAPAAGAAAPKTPCITTLS
jgi:4-hydroxy-tetrahydrodipicolinate synthase